MKIEMHHSIVRAQQVIRKVIAGLDIPGDETYVYVTNFCNCREQGLAIVMSTRHSGEGQFWVCVAENRNSDDTVVYVSESKFAPDNGMMPTDDAWKTAKYFREGKAGNEKAASYIRRIVRSRVAKENKQCRADRKSVA